MNLRIGMLAPITHPYPPQGYGPWERVAHDLTETLVEQGHEVVLFAPAESVTGAILFPTVESPLATMPGVDWRRAEDHHITTALTAGADLGLDLIHSHLHVHVLDRAEGLEVPVLSTLHGVAWDSGVRQRLRRHASRPFVSLSNQEREFLPELNYVATIPNGIRTEDFPPGSGGGGYLVFVGRLAPEKAPHLAVEVAKRSGMSLLVAGPIEERHRAYASEVLQQAGRGVDYLGPLDREEVALLLRDAAATVMPLEWDEPFGLVVVESLSSGTPVVAWRRGAMPEILEDGVTGFLVDDVAGAVASLDRLGAIDRALVASEARRRFDRGVMARSYAGVYETVSESPRAAGRARSPRS